MGSRLAAENPRRPDDLLPAVLRRTGDDPNRGRGGAGRKKLPALQISSKVLLQRYAVENVACRGGSGDQTETWEHCGKRDYIAELLSYIGITP
jgi:hypothetical protein